MNEQSAELDPNTHRMRVTQAVTQAGVGGMADFPDQSLMMAKPEMWTGKRNIYDDRFAKSLGVTHFAVPTHVAYVRFPEWYHCPKCHRFQPIDKWVELYRRMCMREYAVDPEMVKHMKCPFCRFALVPAGFVVACEAGHISDFPWVEVVHLKSHRQVCGKPELSFYQTGEDGMTGLKVKCKCGAKMDLDGILRKDYFEKCDLESGKTGAFMCKRHHPFNNKTDEKCGFYPKAFGRGSSPIYFPLTYSSLVIPPYADKLRMRIEQSNVFASVMETLEMEDDDNERQELIDKKIPKWAEKIGLEIGAEPAEVERVLRHKLQLTGGAMDEDIAGLKYRMEEYDALNGTVKPTMGAEDGDFVRTGMNVEEYKIPHLKSIALIEKVRVVTAFVGFSRVNPVSGMDDARFVKIKESRTDWYPANEVRGEGIFIEFKEDEIEEWIRDNPDVAKRADILNRNYKKTSVEHKQREITPKFLMLHTLSHLLIRQLSFECGYNVSSLCERLYCAEESDGKVMSGIFIYTASGDAEGTLGGLVRQGRPDVFPNILKKAIKGAFSCSNDPVCIMSKGQGREALNLAACYACALVPETCCDERDVFLDRGMIVGTYENRDIGFWHNVDEIEYVEGGDTPEVVVGGWGKWPTGGDGGNSSSGGKGAGDGEPVVARYIAGEMAKDDYPTWGELEAIIEGVDVAKVEANQIPLPTRYGGKFVINGEFSIEILLAWEDAKRAIVETDFNEAEELAVRELGWEVYMTGDDITETIIKTMKES